MTAKIKYLLFKGLSKKEEILFKSFLNLAKNDLDYQIVVLKANQIDADDPDIIIVDQNYQFESDELEIAQLPTVTIGDDHRKDADDYVTRPVQWSEFKHAITSLNIPAGISDQEVERILPDDMRLVIAGQESTSDDEDEAPETSEPSFSDEGDYEYELDKMSIDYHSFTNSDYIKVVDDVRQFHSGVESPPDEPVILVTNDESASLNSVLVLETNSMDAWELSDSEFSSSEVVELDAAAPGFDEPVTEEVILDQRVGFHINRDDEFWNEDNEIIVNNKSFLFIKPERGMVYSELEPGKWPLLMQRGSLSKAPLANDWRPQGDLVAYPISSLHWVCALVNAKSNSDTPFDEATEYQLESWPQFNLLELDNVLLKLCTMLFVRPESVSSLAAKSGYGRSTIRGLMNACHKMGHLKLPEEITGEQMVAATSAEEGMLGRIKDVFR